MLLATPAPAAWHAALSLEFERRGSRTVLARRSHEGPLVVQKALHPEGDAPCHAIVVHPPGGIAGGDVLRLEAHVGAGASALLTTPGAAKWYRSAGPRAESDVRFDVAEGGALEWLPQEALYFDGAWARSRTTVMLSGGARYLGWEIACLGRTHSGERFTRGLAEVTTEIFRDGQPLFIDRLRAAPGEGGLASPAGFAGRPVFGMLLAAHATLATDPMPACRAVACGAGEAAVTRLPGVVVARYLGHSTEQARAYFTALWAILRPALFHREAQAPRIWRT